MNWRCVLGHDWSPAFWWVDASYAVRCSRCGAQRPATTREIMEAFEQSDVHIPRHFRDQYAARHGRPRA